MVKKVFLYPIRPRAGIRNSSSVTPCSVVWRRWSSPFRFESSSMIFPENGSGTSTMTTSIGSNVWPLSSFIMTFGLPRFISNPSRRIDSISTAKWSSPRPATVITSWSAQERSIWREIFIFFSFSRRSLILCMVTYFPDLPEKGLVLTQISMEITGSPIEIGGSCCFSKGSHRVSPIVISRIPEMVTTSPV